HFSTLRLAGSAAIAAAAVCSARGNSFCKTQICDSQFSNLWRIRVHPSSMSAGMPASRSAPATAPNSAELPPIQRSFGGFLRTSSAGSEATSAARQEEQRSRPSLYSAAHKGQYFMAFSPYRSFFGRQSSRRAGLGGGAAGETNFREGLAPRGPVQGSR